MSWKLLLNAPVGLEGFQILRKTKSLTSKQNQLLGVTRPQILSTLQGCIFSTSCLEGKYFLLGHAKYCSKLLKHRRKEDLFLIIVVVLLGGGAMFGPLASSYTTLGYSTNKIIQRSPSIASTCLLSCFDHPRISRPTVCFTA